MNHYLEEIHNLAMDKQKAVEYIALCNGALNRDSPSGYVERHHMFPRCLCRTKEESTDINNIVVFTAREHFLAHKLLSEMFSGVFKRKMLHALSAMSFRKNGLRILDEDDYVIAKEASSLAKKGIPLSEEHKQKIRNSFAEFNPNKGRHVSAETKEKQSIAKMGKPHFHSAETRRKLSISRIGLVIENNTCPHCGKSGKPGPMGKWHFDNCKIREA